MTTRKLIEAAAERVGSALALTVSSGAAAGEGGPAIRTAKAAAASRQSEDDRQPPQQVSKVVHEGLQRSVRFSRAEEVHPADEFGGELDSAERWYMAGFPYSRAQQPLVVLRRGLARTASPDSRSSRTPSLIDQASQHERLEAAILIAGELTAPGRIVEERAKRLDARSTAAALTANLDSALFHFDRGNALRLLRRAERCGAWLPPSSLLERLRLGDRRGLASARHAQRLAPSRRRGAGKPVRIRSRGLPAQPHGGRPSFVGHSFILDMLGVNLARRTLPATPNPTFGRPVALSERVDAQSSRLGRKHSATVPVRHVREW